MCKSLIVWIDATTYWCSFASLWLTGNLHFLIKGRIGAY